MVCVNVIVTERSRFPPKMIVQNEDFPPPGQVLAAKSASFRVSWSSSSPKVAKVKPT